jgi:anaerobic ribonucleoside-triphosphate reductase activating protein
VPEQVGAPSLTRASELKVGGLTPFSATDYPGQLATVVFVQGCPWRCGYCHNPHLQPRTADSPQAWDDVLRHLRRRVGLVDAVVFSGGEPTMDPALADAMHEARALGFGIGLHTAGIYPRRLAEVLPLVDWVGLDVKAGWASYDAVTRIAGSAEAARASTEAVLRSGVAHEVRTTLHPALHTAADLLALATELSALGVRRYVVQQFRATGCADGALVQTAASEKLDDALLARLHGLFPEFVVRDGR